MKLYKICYQVNKSDAYVEFKLKDYHNIFQFFFQDIDNHIINTELKAFAQPGLTDNLLSRLDCVNTIVGIPLFSEKFRMMSCDLLYNDVSFHPCLINNRYKYYACRVKNKFQLIDYEKSIYKLSKCNENPILYEAVYLAETQDNFYIARDAKYLTEILASELLRDFIINNHLKVKLREINSSGQYGLFKNKP